MPPRTMPPPIDRSSTDWATFAAFLHGARPRVLAFLQRLCPGDAEDLLQETLAKVWRLREGFDPRRNGEAWLLQSAFRVFCDNRKRRQRAHGGDSGSGDATLEPAPARPCEVELRDEVAHALAALTPLQRELLLGFHAHGLTLRALAARHALPLNTVKSHLRRARRLLQNGREGGER
jgi:RNA polymerase sigma-70 factor (ECF subfamily)